jgi:CspA family cold shock protein
MSELLSAKVKWFDQKKGYGFLQLPSGGLDIFVHADQLRKSGISRSLVNGEEVNFEISSGPKGNFATAIKLKE